jgi:hypothetical protein
MAEIPKLRLRKSSSAASQSPVLPPFASASRRLVSTGEELPQSKIEFDLRSCEACLRAPPVFDGTAD